MNGLDAEQMAAYDRDGFILIKGLLSREEAAGLRSEAHEVLRLLAGQEDPTWKSAGEVAMGMQTSLKHCHDTQFYSAGFSRLLVDPRFTSVAASLIGSPNVQLHHTKLFVKPPEKGSPFPMHQDYPFFPHRDHTVGAVIFFLDDATEEKGCVRVVPGSHKRGPLEHNAEGSYHLSSEEWPFDAAVPVPAEAGDAIFFSYFTVHGSGVNVSDEPRTTWLVQYRDASDRPTTDQHTHSRGAGMMLAGNDPTAHSRPPKGGAH